MHQNAIKADHFVISVAGQNLLNSLLLCKCYHSHRMPESYDSNDDKRHCKQIYLDKGAKVCPSCLQGSAFIGLYLRLLVPR